MDGYPPIPSVFLLSLPLLPFFEGVLCVEKRNGFQVFCQALTPGPWGFRQVSPYSDLHVTHQRIKTINC